MNRLNTPPADALLRQAVAQLCELAASGQPTLAPVLAALRQAADSDDAAALHQALAALATRSAATGPGAWPIGTAEGRLIASVLDTLALPVALEPLARDLRQALTDPAGRARLADQLLHLLAEARAHAERRQAELQEFLKATVGRLVQLEAALGEAQRQSHQAGDESRQTRQVTELQVVQLRSAATEANDLERLKAFIEARLDHLQEHLRRQDSTEQVHQQTLEAQLSALGQQLAALSTETVALRSRLDVTTEEALRDPLTGAYNRLAYDRRAALEVSRWRSDGGHLAMIVCDIDHFKRINDTFGHAAGDKVLKEISRALQEQLRSADFVARYGGEEFVVLLNGATPEAALQVAEKLRRSVKATPFRSRGQRVPVTLSCGVSGFEGDDTLESVFERADAALFAAKAAGRDRCVLSTAATA
ncbi:GGDEF domain-containing protein [Immundisolibacter sp.]|uniref:GGDEF domain-containing protein n=1 Tax=Immundisolibacter sp. TaxID=1934948 RepID=UPI0026158FBE|nr:GGDEF domain-containing protein [Immundisolibacter sp.]MDD3650635.1 diguanylate cyclase [Immundisolibacter sp.]